MKRPAAERVRLARSAMATRFEAVLVGDDPVRLRAAGEEALREIERVDRRLSTYRPDSEVSRLNRSAARAPVRVSGFLLDLLARCVALAEATDGAFDVTLGRLMHVWGLRDGAGATPDAPALDKARAASGFGRLALDGGARTVGFAADGLSVDFGGIGKGLALDLARDVLAEHAVQGGLLHGGTSSAVAWGTDVGASPWRIAVAHPFPGRADETVATTVLEGDALSVSSVFGKGFRTGNRWHGHVLDGRTGRPVETTHLAAVVAPSATDADALSTALLVLGPDEARRMPAFGRVSWMTGIAGDDATLTVDTGGVNPARFRQ